jgi:energy-coupling factor transport system ATP-binding protein
MIRAEGIRAGYDRGDGEGPPGAPHRLVVLDGIDLEVRAGEAVALVGANGSGKSTLLRVLAGLASPWAGRVLFDGQDVATAEGLRAARLGIGVLFANPEWTLVAPTVEREIAFGLENHRWERAAMGARVRDLLERFDLADRAGDAPLALSGGERARVALAAALAPRPRCLLVDEALALLDARHREAARALIDRARREEGAALVWATQDFEEAALADRVLVLDAGRIVREIARASLLEAAGDLGRFGLRPPPLAALRRALAEAGLDPGPSLEPRAMAEHLDARAGAGDSGPRP